MRGLWELFASVVRAAFGTEARAAENARADCEVVFTARAFGVARGV